MSFREFKVGEEVEAAFGKCGPCWNGTMLRESKINHWKRGTVLMRGVKLTAQKNAMILVRFNDGSAKGFDWYWEEPTVEVQGIPLGWQPGYLRHATNQTEGRSNAKSEFTVPSRPVPACQKKNPLRIRKIVERGKWMSTAAIQSTAQKLIDETNLEIKRTLREWPICPNGGTVTLGEYLKMESVPDNGLKYRASTNIDVPTEIEFEWKCSFCPCV